MRLGATVNEVPVGRRQVFEAIVSKLDSPKPGVIVVAGGAGSGRTHLLQHLTRAAEERGYRVLSGTAADPVAILPTTTMADVRRHLAAMSDAGAADAVGDRRTDPTPQQGGSNGAVRRGFDRVMSQIGETLKISGLLARMAPLLVAVDGFEPSPSFALWFTAMLIPQLRTLDRQVAFVITGGPEALRLLTDRADLNVALGPLDAGEVRAHLLDAAIGFSPPLTSAEIDRYVAAAAAEPAVFSALSMVFAAYRPAGAEADE
jgi:molybdopterin-guanine dinucleotide biosynthesis protein